MAESQTTEFTEADFETLQKPEFTEEDFTPVEQPKEADWKKFLRGVTEPFVQAPIQLQENVQQVPTKAAELMGQVAEPVTETGGRVLADFLNRTGIDPSAMPGRPILERVPTEIPGTGFSPLKALIGKEAGAGVEEELGKLTTPEMASVAPWLGIKPVQQFIQLQSLLGLPGAAEQAAQAQTPKELGSALTQAAINIGIASHLPKATAATLETLKERIPDASSIEEAATVHGDLRPPTGEEQGEVPITQGSGGVLPQTEGGIQEGQTGRNVLLTPEIPKEPTPTEATTVPKVEEQTVAEAVPPGEPPVIQAGAAHVEEIPGGSATSLKNIQGDMERAGLDLGKAPAHEVQNMTEAWMRADRTETVNPGTGEALANELLNDPSRRLGPDDSALLLRYKRDLLNKINDAAEKTHVGDAKSRETAGTLHKALNAKFNDLLDAIKQAGSYPATEMRWRQALVKEDYTFQSRDELNRYYRSLSGRDMVPDAEPTAGKIAGHVKEVTAEADDASAKLLNEITAKAPPSGPDILKAERAAQDAVWKMHRDNATALAVAENKARVAEAGRQQEIANLEVERAQKAYDLTMKQTREAAVRVARAEAEVKEKVRLDDQAKAAQAALDAATKMVKKQAVDLANAENATRMARNTQERRVAKVQEKAARKALDVVDKMHRDAATALAKAQRALRDDPVKAVWGKVRDYLDRVARGEEDFDDVRNKVALELGMKPEAVTRIMGRDATTKRLMDDAWLKQQKARLFREEAKRWVAGLDTPEWEKYVKSVPRVMFGLKTFGHGTVPLGTHAPFVLFDPRYTVNYLKRYGTLYHMVANKAFYENQMRDLERRPNYVTARRAGLVNDPSAYEDYTNPELVKYITGGQIGNRGFSVLKILRQDIFDARWNKLPKSMQTDAMAKEIANRTNHITGVTKAMAPHSVGTALFAPRLFGSRVAEIYVDPARAAWLMRKVAWGSATPEERAFIVEQVTSKALMAGTLYALLNVTQGILAATGSKQKINGVPEALGGAGIDPMRSDWMKFKGFGSDFAYGNAMLSQMRLPFSIYRVIKGTNSKTSKIVYDDESIGTVLLRFGRGQLSPYMGTLVDLGMGSDFASRPLPSKAFGTLPQNKPVPKRLRAQGYEQYTWPEYWSEQLSPIPWQELLKSTWLHGMGMTQKQVEELERAMAATVINAATGGRVTEDIPPRQPGPYQ